MFRKYLHFAISLNESSLAYRLCRLCNSYFKIWKDALETSQKSQDIQVSRESKPKKNYQVGGGRSSKFRFAGSKQIVEETHLADLLEMLISYASFQK